MNFLVFILIHVYLFLRQLLDFLIKDLKKKHKIKK